MPRRLPLPGLILAASAFYLTQDAANDAIIYNLCKDLAEKRAKDHERFLNSVGGDFSELKFGPWWNSSVNLSQSGTIAAVTLPCRGGEKGSDITIKIVRRGSGFRWPLLYNIFGGEWDVIVMDAKIGPGLLSSMSLLESQEPELQGQQHGTLIEKERTKE